MCADIDNETSALKGSEKGARRVRAGSLPRACVGDEGRTSCLCNLCCRFFRVAAVQVRESICWDMQPRQLSWSLGWGGWGPLMLSGGWLDAIQQEWLRFLDPLIETRAVDCMDRC